MYSLSVKALMIKWIIVFMFAATREYKSNNFSFFLQKKEQKHNLLLFCPCKKNTKSFDGMLFFFLEEAQGENGQPLLD